MCLCKPSHASFCLTFLRCGRGDINNNEGLLASSVQASLSCPLVSYITAVSLSLGALLFLFFFFFFPPPACVLGTLLAHLIFFCLFVLVVGEPRGWPGKDHHTDDSLPPPASYPRYTVYSPGRSMRNSRQLAAAEVSAEKKGETLILL